MERIVLAYSGGLDTSVAIPWLAETLGAEVIAVTLDLGQGSELNQVRERALAAGAVRAHVLDVRDEFARELRPAGAAGRRALRGPVSARRRARAAADGADARRDRRDGGRDRHRARVAPARATVRRGSISRCARSIRRCASSRPRATGA